MYPDVYVNFQEHIQTYGKVKTLPTSAFFYGLKQNEEVEVKLGQGKTIIIRLIYQSEADENGLCTVTFDLNGQTRSVQIRDQSAKATKRVNPKATEDNHMGAPLLGKLSTILVKPGQKVKKNDPLFIIEAMKMESTITANHNALVNKICIQEGELVEQGDLVIEFKN